VIGSARGFDGSGGVRAKCQEIVSRLRCGAGGADDGAVIIVQDVD
jgi:hypothetical protein